MDCRLYLTLITEAAEIKSADVIQTKHLSNVKDFQDEYPDCRSIVVSRNKMSRRQGNFEILYISNFLQKMWNRKLFLIITKSKSDSTAVALWCGKDAYFHYIEQEKEQSILNFMRYSARVE